MNHDATHCLDCKSDCPKSCFRAQLTRELEKIVYTLPVSWSHFYGTKECEKRDGTMMTDNEIIKAFTALILNFEGKAKDIVTLCCAYDRIKQQKAEIERLNHIRAVLSREIDELKAEIDQFADIGKMYSEIKADAYKKFAELLKEKRGLYGEIWDEDIDNIVKEMIGDNDGNL